MPIITCPNCKSVLVQSVKSMRCENSHCFDLAKQGYVNLLLANKKRNSNPGDNKIMIDARETFLSTGHYDFLIEGMESAINSLDIFGSDEIHLLDVGCGSGYYTRNLFKEKAINKVGIDISKIGISKAAVMDKVSTYIVGSAFELPIADDGVDLLLNIFSPIDLEECKRVLKPGGYFIKVVPIGDHMKEVAELVYKEVTPHESSVKADLEADAMFQVVHSENLKSTISLEEQNLHDFITMTPYLYKFEKGQLASLITLSVSISFELIIAKFN